MNTNFDNQDDDIANPNQGSGNQPHEEGDNGEEIAYIHEIENISPTNKQPKKEIPQPAKPLSPHGTGNIPQQFAYGSEWPEPVAIGADVIPPQYHVAAGLPVTSMNQMNGPVSESFRQYQAMTWCPKVMALLFGLLALLTLLYIPFDYNSSEECGLYSLYQLIQAFGLILFIGTLGFLYRAMTMREINRFQQIQKMFTFLGVIAVIANAVMAWASVTCWQDTALMIIGYFALSTFAELLILFYFHFVAKKVYEYIVIRLTNSNGVPHQAHIDAPIPVSAVNVPPRNEEGQNHPQTENQLHHHIIGSSDDIPLNQI